MVNTTEDDANVPGADDNLYHKISYSNSSRTSISCSGTADNKSDGFIDAQELKKRSVESSGSEMHFTNKRFILRMNRLNFLRWADPMVKIFGQQWSQRARDRNEWRRVDLRTWRPVRRQIDNVADQTFKSNGTAGVEVKHGIGWIVAAMFILADLVGGGVVAMPAGFVQTGLAMGIIFMVVICSFFLSTGWLLADTWNIMGKRWPEYRLHCRKPYPEMGLRSIGKAAEIATKALVYFTLCGTGIVYLLLSSKIFHNLLGNLHVNFSFCWLIIIVAVLILPITFLKSPADYWLAIVAAVFCTMLAILLIFIGVSLDLHDCYPESHYSGASFNSVLSLGIFLFAFNGHQVFPTVQNDMHDPPQFKKSVFLGFFLVALLYMPLSIYSFIVYGDSMSESVIDSVQTGWIRYVADLAIAIHCILTIIITVNPINLQLEDTFSIPHKFCMKRVIVRTLLMVFILFIGLTIPNFSSVMDLFGSTTIPCTCIILPSLFTLYIHAARYDEKTKTWIRPTFLQAVRRTPKMKLAYLIIMNTITIICAVISFYMSIKAIVTIKFTPPCYVIPFKRNYIEALAPDIVNCCGKYANITRMAGFTC